MVHESVRVRAVEITYNVISDQGKAIYFDLRSDQGQIIFVIFLPYEKRSKSRSRSAKDQIKILNVIQNVN